MRMVARALALLVLTALLVPATAAGARKKPLKVGLSYVGQERILRSGKVPVIVRTRKKGKVRLTLTSRETGPRGGKWEKVGKTRMVRFRKRGRKRARIVLTSAGRKQLSACGGRRLRVTARR